MQADGVLQVGGEPGENLREQAALLAGVHHAVVEALEGLGMLHQRRREVVAALDPRADVADDIAHDLVVRLLGQPLEGTHDGDARVNHRGELAGEHHQVLQWDRAAGGLALLPAGLLDGDDEEVAVQQIGNGILLGVGLDDVPNLLTGGGFTGDVAEGWHSVGL